MGSGACLGQTAVPRGDGERRADGEKIPPPLAKDAMWGEGRMQDKNKWEDKNLSLTLDPLTFHF